MQNAKKSMQGDVSEFIERHIKKAEAQLEAYNNRRDPVQRLNRDGLVYAFAVDLDEPYPVCAHVINEFCKKYCNQDAQLVLYLGSCRDIERSYERVLELLAPHSDMDCCIQIIDERGVTLRDVIRNVDGYITNRSGENIYATCIADLYEKSIISGVDRPIF